MPSILRYIQQSLTETQQNQVFTNWGLGSVARLNYETIIPPEVYGIITVNYPSGAVCTISNGTTTYTAPSTSGSWSCEVNALGTWTITAVGTSTISGTVTLTSSASIQSITLKYQTTEPAFSFTCNGTTYNFDSSSTTSSVSGVYYFYKSGSNWEFYAFKDGTLTVTSNVNMNVDIFLLARGSAANNPNNYGNGCYGGNGGARKTVSNVTLNGSKNIVIGLTQEHSTLGSYTSSGGTVSSGGRQNNWTFYAGENGGYCFNDSTAKGPDGNSRLVGAGGGHGGYSETDGTSQGSFTVNPTNGGSYGGGNGGVGHIDGSTWYANDGKNATFYGGGGGGAGVYYHTGQYVDRYGKGNPGSGYQGFVAMRNAR